MAHEILNWQDGVARVVNNRGLYAKLLGRFADSLGDAPEKLEAALAAGNLDDAQMQAHTIKGTAANLGAEALAETGRILETALKDGTGVEPAIAELRKVLATTVEAMKAFQP